MVPGEIAVAIACNGVTSREVSFLQTQLHRAAKMPSGSSSMLEGKRS
jgi:hypothetical protein